MSYKGYTNIDAHGAATRPLVLPRSTAHYIRITVDFYALRLVRSLIAL